MLDVRSARGLEGVATDCRMLFDVRDDGDDGAVVDLTMSYEPTSPLATLAAPVLIADNWFALTVLLQNAMDARPKLDRYRSLMGTLYGVAGLAHAADCLGGSSLLRLAGAPPFAQLPAPGQALAALWCLSGPAAYACSRRGGAVADLGLLSYGAVECLGAGLAQLTYGGDALPNAVAVQAVVLAAYAYSAARDRAPAPER